MRLLSSSSLALRTAFASLGLLALGGCASSLATQERVVVAVDTPPPMSNDKPIEISEPVPATESPPPPNRRLSHTVTLGQGTTEGYTPMPAPESQGTSGGPNVIVNNNVTVVGGTPAYGGYYGGYGYSYGGGGYGTAARGQGRGNGTTYGGASNGGASNSGTHQAWAPTGWEGAGRTAAPGHTPAVGGNYARAPNSGPAPMR